MKSKENVEILTRIGNSDYESIELSRNSTKHQTGQKETKLSHSKRAPLKIIREKNFKRNER